MLRARRRIVLVVVVLGLMVLAFWGGRRILPSGAVSEVQFSARNAPTATAVAAPASPAFASPTPTRPAPQSDVSLAALTARELRVRARYPHHSQPVAAGDVDPILRDRRVSQNRFAGPDGAGPVLVLYPEQVNFEHPETVILRAHLRDVDTPVAAQSVEGEVLDAQGQRIAQLTYVAEDFEYVGRLAPGEADKLVSGAYLVRVRAVTSDGDERTGTTGFLYSRPTAQPTGLYSDALVDGNLEIRAEVQVQEAGRYHLEGTIYTRDGAPIAWAQNALTLAPGARWIPLSFFGLILRERGEEGPYVLRYAALSTVTGMPNAKNRLIENAHVTNPYHATDFSDQPYGDAALLDAAQRMESAGSAVGAANNGAQTGVRP